jgi:hypothetical protein
MSNWSTLTTDQKGLIPGIVQDAESGAVLCWAISTKKP